MARITLALLYMVLIVGSAYSLNPQAPRAPQAPPTREFNISVPSKPTPTKVKVCQCSSNCACGCNEGGVCQCNSTPVRATQSYAPTPVPYAQPIHQYAPTSYGQPYSYQPAQQPLPVQQYQPSYQPPQFLPESQFRYQGSMAPQMGFTRGGNCANGRCR